MKEREGKGRGGISRRVLKHRLGYHFFTHILEIVVSYFSY
jgi:hypothetical protein